MAVVGNLEDLIRRGDGNERMKSGLRYLLELGKSYMAGQKAGYRHQIDLEPGLLWAIHQVYETRPTGQVRLEAHRRFVDIQYIHSGEEVVLLAPIDGARETIPYEAGSDTAFYEAERATELLLGPGMAVVLFPEDLHAPGIHLAGRMLVKKTVVKAAV